MFFISSCFFPFRFRKPVGNREQGVPAGSHRESHTEMPSETVHTPSPEIVQEKSMPSHPHVKCCRPLLRVFAPS